MKAAFAARSEKHAARKVRNEEACAEVEQDLDQQNRAEIAPAEDGENRSQKCRVARQAGRAWA